MSLPAELRVLCHQLKTTAPTDLPRLLPTLTRYVNRCRGPLSAPETKVKADASATSVKVHELKTYLSTLLTGRSPEGRFAAVVLIKSVVEVGGWEVLRGSEKWVRGLLAILSKPDSHVVKELCIVTITKIYCMTHQYQTLVREITTPTLPTFIQACINVASPKSSSDACPQSLVEAVFCSFAALLARHSATFRPFVSQTRALARPFVAPTMCDGVFVSSSLKASARRIVVDLHRTVAKKGGGDEWEKNVRELVKNVHVTADQAFRAIVEDWESSSGYVAEPVDVNNESTGGARSAEDLPQWTGVASGVERLVGLIELLGEYFKSETETSVALPAGSVLDMLTRILTLRLPSQDGDSEHGSVRLHPAIDRDERDELSSGLPQVYVAALQLIGTVADRLQANFISLAQGSLDLVSWAFRSGNHSAEFRTAAYEVLPQIMSHISGNSFDKARVTKLIPVIKSCCEDASIAGQSSTDVKPDAKALQSSHTNADTFLPAFLSITVDSQETELSMAASALLPILLSQIPQGHLDISIRSLLERTAILTHNKDAMLASILNPFVGKNGKAITSLLPHLSRAFPGDYAVETLLRPRLPMVPAKGTFGSFTKSSPSDDITEDVAMDTVQPDAGQDISAAAPVASDLSVASYQVSQNGGFNVKSAEQATTGANASAIEDTFMFTKFTAPSIPSSLPGPLPVVSATQQDDLMSEDEDEDSDDESVHLNMELDSDSE